MNEHIPAFSSLNPVGSALAARIQPKRNSLRWVGNLSLMHGAYEVPTLDSFELDGRYLYEEKQKLVDALESWLAEWRWNDAYYDEDD